MTNSPELAISPGNNLAEQADAERLGKIRARLTGEQGGDRLATVPSLFTPNGKPAWLADIYRGHCAFLICAGPSLTNHDLSMLNQRGILTLAVNNAAAIYRSQLWCSVDDPGNFCDAIWKDPGILKFVPHAHLQSNLYVRDEHQQLIESPHRVQDMPAVFAFHRNEQFVAERWLYEETFNWGMHGSHTDADGNRGTRSVVYVALRLLFYLGVRRVFLLGCDFRMKQGAQNYAFEQDRSPGSVRGNNRSFEILNSRLRQLLPYFQQENFEIVNCTPDSGLTTFEYLPYDDAIKAATSNMPNRIVTGGMYDRNQRAKDAARNVRSRRCYELNDAARSILSELTLVTFVDELYADKLKQTWSTWMKFRPELQEISVVVVHDARFDPHTVDWNLDDHPQVRFVPWSLEKAETQHERMITARVKVPADEVNTRWFLQLDADTFATRRDYWIDAAWFEPDKQGRLPAYIASPWSYTKPANGLQVLDDWADNVPQLNGFPRLDIPFEPAADRVKHERMAAWCLFGNTAWMKEVAAFTPQRLPVPADDTHWFYCAARRNNHVVHVCMRQFGWGHISDPQRLARKCEALLDDDQ